MARYIEVACPDEACSIVCDALNTYAHITYPKKSGSECNQVARDALITAAQQFHTHHQQTGKGRFSRRIRATLKQAIETYFTLAAQQTIPDIDIRHKAILLSLADGQDITPEQFTSALPPQSSPDSPV